jgi:hypothetical protein
MKLKLVRGVLLIANHLDKSFMMGQSEILVVRTEIIFSTLFSAGAPRASVSEAPRLARLYPTLKLKNCPGPAFWWSQI